jgi:hypothetical protein
MVIRKYGRYWAVYDAAGALVCVCIRRAPLKSYGACRTTDAYPSFLSWERGAFLVPVGSQDALPLTRVLLGRVWRRSPHPTGPRGS